MRDAYKKLRFLNHKERVAGYKRDISAHYRSFQVQLDIAGIDAALADNAKVQARFDTTDLMLSQIAEAVAQRQVDQSIKGKPSASTATVKGVLISGYVRPALQKVESISSNIPRGAIRAIPIKTTFSEAAQECRRRCSELALTCSRDNTFYRDPEFEIDVDLVEGNRNCLDNLLYDAQTPSERYPMSVHRVRDIFPNPVFFSEASLGAEVKWDLATRWWQAGIATAFNAPALINQLCVSRDEKAGIYGFLFHRDGEWAPVIVDDMMYLTSADWDELNNETRNKLLLNAWRQSSSAREESYRQYCQTSSRSLYFSASIDQNETWLPLLEKAYAKAHGDYSALDWGNPGYGVAPSTDCTSCTDSIVETREALEDLTGGVSTQLHVRDIIDRDRFWDEQLKNINNGYFFTVRTKPYTDFETAWSSDLFAPSGTPILRTYEGFGLRLLLLK